MKAYKWLRGLLKVSALTMVMFVMQACYGTPQQFDDTYVDEDEKTNVVTDGQQQGDQQQVDQQALVEAEAE